MDNLIYGTEYPVTYLENKWTQSSSLVYDSWLHIEIVTFRKSGEADSSSAPPPPKKKGIKGKRGSLKQRREKMWRHRTAQKKLKLR